MKFGKMMALGRAVGRNEIDRIESLCTEALKIDRQDLMALMMLADTYWRNEQQERALSPALQALAVEPNEFYALRIVAGVYAEREEHESAYRYAKRILTTDPPTFPPTKAVSRILAPFTWLPKVRRMKEQMNHDEKSYFEWLQWAKGYVSWYESRVQFAP